MNWFEKLSWLSVQAEGVPPILAGLVNEARKYNSPEEFQKAFLGEIKHGMYWHVTEDPEFFIDPDKGPSDMSSMSGGHQISLGKLMITSDIETWASNYAPNRSYAALIDMSYVSPEKYTQVNRGFGNEFFVHDPSQAKVIGVFSIKDALRIDHEHHSSLPQDFNELTKLWRVAQQVEMPHLSKEQLASHYEHLTEEDWTSQWEEEWSSEWNA